MTPADEAVRTGTKMGAYGNNRTINYTWTLSEDGPIKRVANLSISHSKHDYRSSEDSFVITLRNMTVEDKGQWTSTSFGVFDGVNLGRIPAGLRYSAKNLDKAAGEALAMLNEAYNWGNESVLAIFAA